MHHHVIMPYYSHLVVSCYHYVAVIGGDNIGYDGVIELAESLWATPAYLNYDYIPAAIVQVQWVVTH